MSAKTLIDFRSDTDKQESSQEFLEKLYKDMLYIRVVEEIIADHYKEQEMRCPVHLCIGQEAVAVGVSAHLTKADAAFSGHRAHGHYLAKGGNLQRMLDEIYGKATGCAKGRGGSMHLIDKAAGFQGSTPIVGGTVPVATGWAMANKMKKNKNVTVCYLGEACTEEGVFHESLNFASLHNLPIVYVIENNLFSVYTHLRDRQPKRSLRGFGIAHDIESVEGDGNDATEVYRTMRPLIKNARDGQGPQIAIFDTYRWLEHCGPNYDNDIGYRTEEEFEEWKKRCPLTIFEDRMKTKGYMTDYEQETLESSIRIQVDVAIQEAKVAPKMREPITEANIYA